MIIIFCRNLLSFFATDLTLSWLSCKVNSFFHPFLHSGMLLKYPVVSDILKYYTLHRTRYVFSPKRKSAFYSMHDR